MKCWVCKRQARGLGHTDNRYGIGDPRRYPMDWVFCSQRCQSAFNAMYGNWIKCKDGSVNSKEINVVNLSDIERNAMRKCLKAFGKAADGIGFDKPLGDYSEPEALQVIEAIVTCFTQQMVEYHEQAKYPPVRGIVNPISDPFADLEDDFPWEAGSQRKESRP